MAAVEHVNSPRGAVQALYYVWDVNTLAWVEGTQPSGGGGGGGAATIADGADVNAGSVADAAITTDVNGTLSGKLRGVVKVLGDSWDSTTHALKVTGANFQLTPNGDVPFYTAIADYTTGVKATVDDFNSLAVRENPFTTALAFDGSNNPIYIGSALQGSAKSASVWQIRKLTYDGSNNVTDIQFANGSPDYNAIWNNRASLSYS